MNLGFADHVPPEKSALWSAPRLRGRGEQGSPWGTPFVCLRSRAHTQSLRSRALANGG